MTQDFKVIQFVHPGFEYSSRRYVGDRKKRSGVMPWKQPPGHDRKFMWTLGSAVDTKGNQWTDIPLTFWGEWEGPSVFWKVESPGKPMPSIIHAPFRPAEVPTGCVQNTDPMVFGEHFIYSNCMQGQYKALQGAPPGSLILFGRYAREDGRPSFSLDTCLVVEGIKRLPTTPFRPEEYGDDIVEDAALHALHSEGFEGELHVHFGRRREHNEVFSFVPARLAESSPALFARPELSPTGALEGVVSPGNMQGIKVTHGLSQAERDAIWLEVASQVEGQSCVLAHHLEVPPLLDEAHAVTEADREPHLLPSATVSN